MIDRQGRPLTDASRAEDGFLLPIGGYKDAGPALMFGLFPGTLNGAAMGSDVVDFNKNDVTPTNTGQAIVALLISSFCDPTAFKRRVDDIARQLKSSATLPGFEAIRLPGEQLAARRRDRGIPVPPPLRASLDRLAGELAIGSLPAG
jgi:L-2-hydroxycarboxylate dehydrogenase (NAD+)